MGVLETAVAVRHDSADDVVDVVRTILRDAGHRVEIAPDAGDSEEPSYDVRVGAQMRGWVSVHPHYVVPPDGLAVALTRRLGTVASAVSIYEDVFWTHDLVARGTVLDRYVNFPGYFGPGEYGPEYSGDPALVADILGAEATLIAPYFRQVSVRRARSRLFRPPKAHASDTYHLLDGWVVTELWERMGITWGGDAPAARLAAGHDGIDALSEYIRAGHS